MSKLVVDTVAMLFVGAFLWSIIMFVQNEIRIRKTVILVSCYSGSLQIYEGRALESSIRNLFSGGIELRELDSGKIMRIDGPCVLESDLKGTE